MLDFKMSVYKGSFRKNPIFHRKIPISNQIGAILPGNLFDVQFPNKAQCLKMLRNHHSG
jgi:hypothetical protein